MITTTSEIPTRTATRTAGDDLKGMKILVALACYGAKNVGYLKAVIASYQQMGANIDIVVTSNDAKDLGPDVEVLVGFPTKNPWSLPFAHKRVFAERIERYDLFIYSEDDLAVTKAQLEAFVRLSPLLAPDEIIGFLRYEVGSDGERSMPDFHGAFRWKVETARWRNGVLVAEYTNLHAGVYVITRRQLKRALAHGEYLRAPDCGEFDIACTAATDPYTRTGLRKVVCLSNLEEFMVHHLSNRYVGKLGTPLSEVRRQARILRGIADGEITPWNLGLMDPKADNHRWSKAYDGTPDEELAELLSEKWNSVLVVGGGFGALERRLRALHRAVTILPIDAIAEGKLESEGFETVGGTFDQATRRLEGREFDAVVLPGVVHLFPEPKEILARLASFVSGDGGIVVSCPNMSLPAVLAWRLLRKKGLSVSRSLRSIGVVPVSPRTVASALTPFDFVTGKAHWVKSQAGRERSFGSRIFSLRWAVCAHRRLRR